MRFLTRNAQGQVVAEDNPNPHYIQGRYGRELVAGAALDDLTRALRAAPEYAGAGDPAVGASLTNDGDAFTLTWAAVPGATEYVVKRAYGATGREFVPVNMTTLTATTFTDATVYDGLGVWYQVYGVVGGVETLAAAYNGIQPARTWQDWSTLAPLASGTYTGLNIRMPSWSNGSTGAIRLQNNAAVTLSRCRVASAEHGITGFGNRITVVDSRLWSLHPGGTGRTHGKAINAESGRHLDVQHSLMEGWFTTELKQYQGDLSASNSYLGNFNIVRNVQGRRTDAATADGYRDYVTADGSDPSGPTSSFERAQAFLLNGVSGVAGAEIGWNHIHNEAGYSRVEDNINTFRSGGTAASPLRIHHNLVMGAYPAFPSDPRSTYFTGGGILSGDVNSQHVDIDDNLIGQTTNYGAGMLGGTGNRARRNRILQFHLLWNGQRITKDGNGNVGFQFWDYNGAGSTIFRDNAADANEVGWQRQLAAGGALSRNDLFIPATTMNGANNTYTNGTAITGPITAAMVYDLFRLHRVAATAAGVTIGPRPAGSP